MSEEKIKAAGEITMSALDELCTRGHAVEGKFLHFVVVTIITDPETKTSEGMIIADSFGGNSDCYGDVVRHMVDKSLQRSEISQGKVQ